MDRLLRRLAGRRALARFAPDFRYHSILTIKFWE